MRLVSIASGQYYKAIYYEYDYESNTWDDIGIEFRYKQQEASRQGVGFVGDESIFLNPTKGAKKPKREFRIVTNENLPFKLNDKIELLDETERNGKTDKLKVIHLVRDRTVTNSLIAERTHQQYYNPVVLDLR